MAKNQKIHIILMALLIPFSTFAHCWSSNDESKRKWKVVSKDFKFDLNSIERNGDVITFDGLVISDSSQPTNINSYSINCKSYEYFDHNSNAYLKALGAKQDIPAVRILPNSNMDKIFKNQCVKKNAQ